MHLPPGDMMLLAQAPDASACGTGLDASLICMLVERYTDDAIALALARGVGMVLRIVLTLIAAWLANRLARAVLRRFERTMERRIEARLERGERRGTLNAAKYRSRRFQRLHATMGVLRGVVGVVVWLVAILVVIDGLGVRMQPILAGAGLASVVLGFGAQQLVRDVLAGIAMLIEDQYGVGDWIDVDGVIGQVEKVGLRATSFRDLDGVLHHVLNGHVQRVGNLSQEWSRSILDVPLALDSDVPTAKAIILKVATDLAEDEVWGEDVIGPPEVWGVQEFGPHGLAIRVSMPTKPMANWDINRQMRERLQHAFDQAHIRMQGQLVELGGMQRGYPVRNQHLDDDAQQTRRPQHRGLVPPDVGPLDQPHAAADADQDDPTETTLDDLTPPEPDMTTELRIERGREVRPD
jgi:moderate conductance mechanosensitive channel